MTTWAPTRSGTSRWTGWCEAAGGDERSFCSACFDGDYPIEVPEGAGKFVLEDQLRLPTG